MFLCIYILVKQKTKHISLLLCCFVVGSSKCGRFGTFAKGLHNNLKGRFGTLAKGLHNNLKGRFGTLEKGLHNNLKGRFGTLEKRFYTIFKPKQQIIFMFTS